MYAPDHEPATDLADLGVRVFQLAVLVVPAGWAAERLVDTGMRWPGLTPFVGAAGLWAGTEIWDFSGLAQGPTIGSFAVLPVFAGALLVSAILKLVSLGFAGPRW